MSEHAADLGRMRSDVRFVEGPGWHARIARFAVRKPLGFAGAVIVSISMLVALSAPLIAPYPFDEAHFRSQLQGPSREFLLGTDHLGRDNLSRLMYGTRLSLGVAFAAMVISKVLGLAFALVSGYYGGFVDLLGQRFVDIGLALPSLILLVTLLGLLGPSVTSMTIAIGVSGIPFSTRLFRSVVVQISVEPYVDAARATGASDLRIMGAHILPNTFPIVLYSASVTLGNAILIVAALGFLGFGLPAPNPDLGGMLSGPGIQYMRRLPLLAVWPGLTITAIAFGFAVFADALRDVLDPRLHGTT